MTTGKTGSGAGDALLTKGGSRSNSVADAAGAKAPKEGRTLNLVPCEKECRRCLTALADWDGSGLIPTCCKDINSRSGKCVRCAAHGKQCSPVAAAYRGTAAALVAEASKEVIEPAKLKALQMKVHRALEAMKKKTGAAAASAAQRLAVREQEARLARERFHDQLFLEAVNCLRTMAAAAARQANAARGSSREQVSLTDRVAPGFVPNFMPAEEEEEDEEEEE
ncbi:unnamed protein product [Clonostachys byssicola]|uniref:Uncharacterized protein n=1 Tax=Clonostachys byssicola TaxID=160290 RepID=A0A9N9U997_9HYPO|nr:unnamed protein product [Clonostachys byssicola]